MKKELIVGVVVGAIALLALVAYLVRRDGRQLPPPVQTITPVLGEIVPFAESGISQEALESSDSKVVNGVKTVLSDDYEEGMPLVEMFFLKRNLDGSTEPLELSSVEVLASNGSGPRIGIDGAHALRKAVTTNDGGLVPGETYRITSYFIGGRPPCYKTAPLNPVFQVPPDLPPNSVYRVKLIIRDEIVEQQVLARKQAKRN